MRGRALANLVLFVGFSGICVSGLGVMGANMGLAVPGQPGWTLRASFATAEGLVPLAQVAVSGVRVGEVREITSDGQGGTLVSMHLAPDVRLRQDVRAVIRPRSLLGEKYVELVRHARSSAAYLKDGDRLPRSQTGQSVEIDDVLNNMDAPSRAAFSQTLRELGVALDGRATDVNTSIPELEQTAANLRPLAQTADARQQEIGRILKDLDIIMAALGDEQESLGELIDSGNIAMGALAQRDQDLGGTVQQASVFFGSLDTAFKDTTPANRAAIAKGPASIQSGRTLLGLLSPDLDRILPETLIGQVNYPSNQLELAHPAAQSLALEWLSAFSETNAAGLHSFRVTNYMCKAEDHAKGCDASPAPSAPAVPKAPGLPPGTAGPLPDALDFLLRSPAP